MRGTLKIVAVLFAAGSLLDFAAAADPVPAFRAEVWSFKHLRSYTVDVTRIAVFDPGGDLRATGESSITPHGYPGWSLVTLPATHRTELAIRAAVANPAALPGIALPPDRAATLFASPVLLDDLGGPMVARPSVLVRFEADVPAAEAEKQLLSRTGVRILERRFGGLSNCFRIECDALDGFGIIALAAGLAQDPLVRFAEPDMVFSGRSSLIPNDPGFSSCWGLLNSGAGGGLVDFDMDATDAWDLTIGDPGVKVVVLDTGVQQDHPDINQVPGADFTGGGTGGGPGNACEAHGTAVAGCVSAIINNGIGVVGAAPGCKVASARPFVANTSVCDGSWLGGSSETVAALNWAQTIGAKVTNNSNYYGFTSSAIADTYAATRSAGIVHFASAGNFATSGVTYPSSIPAVNAVAAMARNGTRAGFSNWGFGLDFSAPGVAILTTDRTGGAGYTSGDYVTIDGTSFASPYSAGVAALIISYIPGLTAFQIEGLMQSGCTELGPPGYDLDSGWGMVNAYLSMTGSPPPPPPPPGPFDLVSPADGAAGVALNTQFFWSASSGAVSYLFTLDDDADFSSPLVSVSTPANSVSASPGLLTGGQTYHWRVTAANIEGATTVSTPPGFAFTTVPPFIPCVGDLTNDGRVDTIDLAVILGLFGQSVPPGSTGDINGDGAVNTIDLARFLGDFGRTDC